MNVVVIGGAGYLGSILTEYLLAEAYNVTVIDSFAHGVPSLGHLCHQKNLTISRVDILAIDKFDFSKVDAVLPLAALVGATACGMDPLRAVLLNHEFIKKLCAILPEETKVIFPCTNSGYGVGGAAECDETSLLNPLTIYGATKVKAENMIMQRANSISFRFATLFGWSPRLRRDLLVNDMVWRAMKDGSAVIFEGHFRRNFLHVRDAAEAFIFMLNNWNNFSGNVFNVGDSRANMTKLDLCKKIQAKLPRFTFFESSHHTDPDKRDYIVSNAKIEAAGWKPIYSLDDGIDELIRGYRMLKGEQYGNS